MFDHLFGDTIVDFVAYGVDEYDFPDVFDFILADKYSFDVGEYGFVRIDFSKGSLWFSTDGITNTQPKREQASPLPNSQFLEKVRDFYIGQKLEFLKKNPTGYYMKLFEFPLLEWKYDINDGHCDRDYFGVKLENSTPYL